MRRDLAAVTLVGLIACHHGPAGRQQTSPTLVQGEWRAEAPMRYARAAHAVVSTDTGIYALGGTGAGSAPVVQVERFDGRTWEIETALPGPGLGAGSHRWQAAPAMPTARNFARAVLFHDAVYVVGGSPTPGQSHASEGSTVVESFRCGEMYG